MSEQMAESGGRQHGYAGWSDGAAYCLCGRTFDSVQAFDVHVNPPAQRDELDAVLDALADAFVEANRSEFLDLSADGELDPNDPDLPILHAVQQALIKAWHLGYGDGSSNATDGWTTPGRQPRRTNPYNVTLVSSRPGEKP